MMSLTVAVLPLELRPPYFPALPFMPTWPVTPAMRSVGPGSPGLAAQWHDSQLASADSAGSRRVPRWEGFHRHLIKVKRHVSCDQRCPVVSNNRDPDRCYDAIRILSWKFIAKRKAGRDGRSTWRSAWCGLGGQAFEVLAGQLPRRSQQLC